MAIKEMKMGFASSEGIFQAETKEACWQHIRSSRLQERLFSDVAEKMCKGTLTCVDHYSLAHLGALNLFALTSGAFAREFGEPH